jgi:putative ABC transport system permease protein
MNDLRYALRQLRRSPGFAIAALLILGLGIGVNASMFSVVSAVLFRPIAVEEPERLVRLHTSQWERSGIPSRYFGNSSLPDFEDLRVALGDVVTGLSAWDQNTVSIGSGESATSALAAFVTGDFFGTYRPHMMLGRGLMPGDGATIDGTSVVIGDGVWRTRFQGDSAVLGRSLVIAGEPFTVVGVADDESLAPMHDQGVDLVLPLAAYERFFLATNMMRGRDNR